MIKDAVYLEVVATVRYWEDATVNGVEDADGTLIPARDGDWWHPIINLETGIIENWQEGVIADVHYKICDAGEYYLLNADMKQIGQYKNYYVPNEILCIGDNGYGDYIILNVLENGQVEGWKKPELDEAWEEF